MRKNLALVLLSLTFLIPGASHAARDYGSNRFDYVGQVYLTLKYGEVTIASDVPENGSDIRNLGFVFGKGFNDNWAMEVEYTTTVSEDDDYFGTGSSAEVDTLGLFVVAKTTGDFYAKGRVGYTRSEQTFGEDTDPDANIDWDGTKNLYGLAYGVAAGYKFMKGGAVELEYMVYPTRDDVEIDFTPVGGPVIEEDLEMDFITLNYVLSFE